MKTEYWKLPADIAKSPRMTGNEKLLYAYLLSDPSATTAPNTQAMAEACGVDKTTTLLSIKGLERLKLLKVTRTKAKKLKRMLHITVIVKKLGRSAFKKKCRCVAKKKRK